MSYWATIGGHLSRLRVSGLNNCDPSQGHGLGLGQNAFSGQEIIKIATKMLIHKE
jgi:hypothetical protein